MLASRLTVPHYSTTSRRCSFDPIFGNGLKRVQVNEPSGSAPECPLIIWLFRCLAIFFLLQNIGGFAVVDRMVYGEWDLKQGDKLSQSLALLQLVFGMILFWRGYRVAGGISRGGKVLFALAGFFLLTTLWSVDPDTTLRRGIIYLLFLMSIYGIAETMDGDEFMDLLCLVCFMAATASIILLIVSPANALGVEDRDLRGVFPHKNILGQVMAAGVLASLHGLRVGGARRTRSLVALLLFIATAFLAKSGTALVTVFGLCFASGVITLFRFGGAARMAGICVLVFAAPVIAFAAISPDTLLELLGKDPTLTGRTELWALVIQFISQRPMLGWGLTAFWTPANPFSADISNTLGWVVPEAHNGLLELLLEIGVAGTGLLLFIIGRNVIFAIRCLKTPAKEIGITSLLCYASVVQIGMTELVLVDQSQVSVGIVFVCGLICERMVTANLSLRRKASAPRPLPMVRGLAPYGGASHPPNRSPAPARYIR
jgi:O-antigen ligase